MAGDHRAQAVVEGRHDLTGAWLRASKEQKHHKNQVILSCAPITGILHAAAVPDGNKKKHSMFYAVFVSDFCELNEIIPKPIRIL